MRTTTSKNSENSPAEAAWSLVWLTCSVLIGHLQLSTLLRLLSRIGGFFFQRWMESVFRQWVGGPPGLVALYFLERKEPRSQRPPKLIRVVQHRLFQNPSSHRLEGGFSLRGTVFVRLARSPFFCSGESLRHFFLFWIVLGNINWLQVDGKSSQTADRPGEKCLICIWRSYW